MNVWIRTTLCLILLGTVSIASAEDKKDSDKKKDKSNADAVFQSAQRAMNAGKHAKAEGLLTKVLEIEPKASIAYYYRGRERFCLGKLNESVQDFDRYVKANPARESRQWERGIAYYYAKQYKKGAAQFALYQTFHDNDVENSVWRYLCMAKTDGVKKAEATILPIKNDRRVPMMEVFNMFRGKVKPEVVLQAAKKGSKDRARGQLFYAHLYLGLYYEAQNKPKLARKHIFEAADKHKDSPNINSYMWEVARLHAELLRAEDKKKKEKETKAKAQK